MLLRFAGCLALLWLPLVAHGERLDTRVVDEAGIFSNAQREALNAAAEQLRARRHIEFVVLTLTSLDGDSIENVAATRFKRYELGSRGIDNGLLLVLALNEHKTRLEVGYGLEGALPDLAANRLLQTELPPYFRKGAYDEGVLHLMAALDAADLRVQSSVGADRPIDFVPYWARLLPIAFFGFFFLFVYFIGYGQPRIDGNSIDAVFGHAWPAEAVAFRERLPQLNATAKTMLRSFIILDTTACVAALFGGMAFGVGLAVTFLSGFPFIWLMRRGEFSEPWKTWHARYPEPIRSKIEKRLKRSGRIYVPATDTFIAAPTRSSGDSSRSSSSGSSSSSSSSSPSDGGSSGGGGSSGSW